MKLRRNLLKRSRLYPVRSPAARVATSNGVYLILNKPGFDKSSLENFCRKIIPSGIGIVQLRDKPSAKADILKLANKLARRLGDSKILFIVNDHPDLALLSGADGVHLGQGDMPLGKARLILGRDKIIGVSCHNKRQALKAQKQGADYIGIGPVYATPTKPEYRPIGLKVLKQLKGKIKIPYFAIGNINKGNIGKIISSGARRVAVSRAIMSSGNIRLAAKELLKRLQTK